MVDPSGEKALSLEALEMKGFSRYKPPKKPIGDWGLGKAVFILAICRVISKITMSLLMNISKLMNERPLSPHLQVYRLPLTAWMSITHRATGVLLSLGMILLVVVLMAVAQGPESFASLHFLTQSAAGRILLWGWIFSLMFHLCHGVRHLIWDAGYGFDRETLKRYAIYELAAAFLLTVLLAFLALFHF